MSSFEERELLMMNNNMSMMDGGIEWRTQGS
jgi:hypothetical protein